MVMCSACDSNGVVSANSFYPYFIFFFLTVDPHLVVLTDFLSINPIREVYCLKRCTVSLQG